jgi:hypothetical protein
LSVCKIHISRGRGQQAADHDSERCEDEGRHEFVDEVLLEARTKMIVSRMNTMDGTTTHSTVDVGTGAS